MKSFNKILLGFLFAGTLSSSFVQAVVVHRLKSIKQVEALDCGYYAAYGAHCMATGKDLDEINKMLSDKNKLEGYLKKWKEEVKKNDSNYQNPGTFIHGDLISKCVLPDLNSDHISIIHSPDHFIKMRDNGFGISQKLFIDIQSFLTRNNPHPHAIVYNNGGHWVAYVIRKENEQVKIYKTDSLCVSATNLNISSKNSIANTFNEWFMGDRPLLPNVIRQQLDSINNLLGQVDSSENKKATLTSLKEHFNSIVMKMFFLGFYDDDFFIRKLGSTFSKLSNNRQIRSSKNNYLKKLRDAVEGFKAFIKSNHSEDLQKDLLSEQKSNLLVAMLNEYEESKKTKSHKEICKLLQNVFVTNTQSGDQKHLTAPNDFSTDYADEIWKNIVEPTPTITASSGKRKRNETADDVQKRRKTGDDSVADDSDDVDMADAQEEGNCFDDWFTKSNTTTQQDASPQQLQSSNTTYSIDDYNRAINGDKNLKGVNLRGADLSNCNLEGVDFTDADLSGAILNYAKLKMTKFVRTNCSNASFIGADLSYSCIGGLEVSIIQNPLITANWMKNNSRSCVLFNNCKFLNAKFNFSKITMADFRGSSFDSTELNNIQIVSCIFNNSKFIKTDWNTSVLLGADFSNCKMQKNKINKISLQYVSFKGSFLNDFVFSETSLLYCDFEDAYLKNITFADCALGNVNMKSIETFADSEIIFNANFMMNVNFSYSTLYNLSVIPFSANDNDERFKNKWTSSDIFKKVFDLHRRRHFFGSNLNFSYCTMKNAKFIGRLEKKDDFIKQGWSDLVFNKNGDSLLYIAAGMYACNFNYSNLQDVVFVGITFSDNCMFGSIIELQKCIFNDVQLDSEEDAHLLKTRGAMVNRMVNPEFESFWLQYANNNDDSYLSQFYRSLVNELGREAGQLIFKGGLLLVEKVFSCVVM